MFLRNPTALGTAASTISSIALLAGLHAGCSDSAETVPGDDTSAARRNRTHDAGAAPDATTLPDAATAFDAAASPDAGATTDSAPPPDAGTFSGATWYVSPSGSNADGHSWATAWGELDQIAWSVVHAGDRIEIGAGTYATALTASKAGAPSQRIVIERATEANHDGPVVIPNIVVTQPYVTIDGHDQARFQIYNPGNVNLLWVQVNDPTDYFEIKNARFEGTPNKDNWGRPVLVLAASGSYAQANVSIDHCFFDHSQGSEDIISWKSTGSLKIEHSVFYRWESLYMPNYNYGSGVCPATPTYGTNGSLGSLCWSHSDLVEGGGTGHTMGDVIFRYNLVDDFVPGDPLVTGIQGNNIAFMTGYTTFRNVEFAYNVFAETYETFQSKAILGTTRFDNTVYYNAMSVGGDGYEALNNIYMLANHYHNEVIWGAAPRYSLYWDDGTFAQGPIYDFQSGSGTNIKADPMFIDPTNILGPDGIPFTADDGFNLKAGSPAIHNGTPTRETVDIRGDSIVGAPNIGPY
jgi:hypothetical protein